MGKLNHFFIPMACMEIFAKVMGMGEKMKYNANWRGAAPYDAQSFSLWYLQESLTLLYGQPGLGVPRSQRIPGSAVSPARDKVIYSVSLSNTYWIFLGQFCLEDYQYYFCCSWWTLHGSSIIHSLVYEGKASQKCDKSTLRSREWGSSSKCCLSWKGENRQREVTGLFFGDTTPFFFPSSQAFMNLRKDVKTAFFSHAFATCPFGSAIWGRLLLPGAAPL